MRETERFADSASCELDDDGNSDRTPSETAGKLRASPSPRRSPPHVPGSQTTAAKPQRSHPQAQLAGVKGRGPFPSSVA